MEIKAPEGMYSIYHRDLQTGEYLWKADYVSYVGALQIAAEMNAVLDIPYEALVFNDKGYSVYSVLPTDLHNGRSSSSDSDAMSRSIHSIPSRSDVQDD